MVFAEKSYGRLETTPLLEKTRDEKKSSFGKKSSFAALLFLAILATVGYAHPAFTHSLLANNNSSAFLGNALFRGNSDRGLFVSPPKLGGEGGAVPKVVLSLACSPGSRIPFDVENYSNVVGAKLITKSMSSEFDFDSAVEMTQSSCGTYELPNASQYLSEGEQFGFFLYRLDGTGSPIKDIGCESMESDARCPVHSSPITDTVGGPFALSSCTTSFTSDGATFYNRVFSAGDDTTGYTWGACDGSCGATQPSECSETIEEADTTYYVKGSLTLSGKDITTAVTENDEVLKAFIASAAGVDASQVSIIVSAALGGKPLTKEAVREARKMEASKLGSTTDTVTVTYEISVSDKSEAETVSATLSSANFSSDELNSFLSTTVTSYEQTAEPIVNDEKNISEDAEAESFEALKTKTEKLKAEAAAAEAAAKAAKEAAEAAEKAAKEAAEKAAAEAEAAAKKAAEEEAAKKAAEAKAAEEALAAAEKKAAEKAAAEKAAAEAEAAAAKAEEDKLKAQAEAAAAAKAEAEAKAAAEAAYKAANPAKYTYTFEINKNVAVSHMEITKILIDGEFPEADLVTVLLEQSGIRDGTDKTVMLDDTTTSYLNWKNSILATGTQVLEIKTRKVVKEFEISYWRPKYAPGWRILLDGKEVMKETENRGSASWPSPATFTYDVESSAAAIAAEKAAAEKAAKEAEAAEAARLAAIRYVHGAVTIVGHDMIGVMDTELAKQETLESIAQEANVTLDQVAIHMTTSAELGTGASMLYKVTSALGGKYETTTIEFQVTCPTEKEATVAKKNVDDAIANNDHIQDFKDMGIEIVSFKAAVDTTINKESVDFGLGHSTGVASLHQNATSLAAEIREEEETAAKEAAELAAAEAAAKKAEEEAAAAKAAAEAAAAKAAADATAKAEAEAAAKAAAEAAAAAKAAEALVDVDLEKIGISNSVNYRGTQQYTIDGLKCETWDSNTRPWQGYYTASQFPNADLGSHNYCRNPAGDAMLWCITSEVSKTTGSYWNWCVPKGCEPKEDGTTVSWCNGVDYRGDQGSTVAKTTEYGFQCKPWSASTTTDATYPDSGLDGQSCRSATEAYGYVYKPWCWVKSNSLGWTWDYCNLDSVTTEYKAPESS